VTTDLADPSAEADTEVEQYKLCSVCRYATPASRDRCHHCLNDVANAQILHPDAAQRRLVRQAEIEVEIADREERRKRYRRIALLAFLGLVLVYAGWWGYRTFIWEPPPLPLPSSSARQLASTTDAWPTTLGDLAATRTTAAVAALGGTEAWRIDLGSALVTNLIADADRLYATMVDDRLVAIDIEDGTVVWERPLQVAPIGAPTVAGTPGGAGSEDGIVYVPMRAGQLLAIDAATGEELFFSINTGARFTSSPIVADGTVYLYGIGDLVAFDAENGDLLWRKGVNSTWATLSPVIANGSVALASGDRSLVYDRVTSEETYFYEFERAHPYSIAYADDVIYTASSRVVTAYDINSRRPWWEGMRAVWFQFEIWQMAPSVPPPPALWATRRPPADGYPMAISDQLIHLANPDGDLRAYARTSGELNWAISTADIVAPPLLTPDGLLIAHPDRLAMYDIDSGALQNEHPFDGDQLEDVVVTSAGTFVATQNGELLALR